MNFFEQRGNKHYFEAKSVTPLVGNRGNILNVLKLNKCYLLPHNLCTSKIVEANGSEKSPYIVKENWFFERGGKRQKWLYGLFLTHFNREIRGDEVEK